MEKIIWYDDGKFVCFFQNNKFYYLKRINSMIFDEITIEEFYIGIGWNPRKLI